MDYQIKRGDLLLELFLSNEAEGELKEHLEGLGNHDHINCQSKDGKKWAITFRSELSLIYTKDELIALLTDSGFEESNYQVTVAPAPWFGPSEKLRKFNCQDYIGRKVCIETSGQEQKGKMYCRLEADWMRQEGYFWSMSGWQNVRGLNLKEESTITNCYLMQHLNGGRSDQNEYSSYVEYFSEERKKALIKEWEGGFTYKVASPGGDNDRCDLFVELSNGLKFESNMYELTAPDEWYSDHYKGHRSLRFADGFYQTAEDAISAFSLKASEDMFGERYFPVLVFEKSVDNHHKLLSATNYAKGYSGLIETNDYLVRGTRCKPDEYKEVIQTTYKGGGKVAIGIEWDWD